MVHLLPYYQVDSFCIYQEVKKCLHLQCYLQTINVMKVNQVRSVCQWVMNKAHYCADTYLIMLAVSCLLTIMFTQRSSCIGRLQVEKWVSLKHKMIKK